MIQSRFGETAVYNKNNCTRQRIDFLRTLEDDLREIG